MVQLQPVNMMRPEQASSCERVNESNGGNVAQIYCGPVASA